MYLKPEILVFVVPIVALLTLTGLVLLTRRPRGLQMNPNLFPDWVDVHPHGVNRVLGQATTGRERCYADFLVRQIGVDPNAGLIIEAGDTSMSMKRARAVFPVAQQRHRDWLARQTHFRANLLQFRCSVRPELIGDEHLRSLDEYVVIEEAQMSRARPGGDGVLNPGSGISDWIRVLGELALAYKRAGVPRVLLVIYTDGWNVNEHVKPFESWRDLSEQLAAQTIKRLRRAGVDISLVGFVPHEHTDRLVRFVRRVGLRYDSEIPHHDANEVDIHPYTPGDPGSLDKALTGSFGTTARSISRTMCGPVPC